MLEQMRGNLPEGRVLAPDQAFNYSKKWLFGKQTFRNGMFP